MMKTKRTLKRILALAICVVMFATLLPISAMAALPTPALPKLSPYDGGVKVSWTAVSGAAKYGINRKTGNGTWSCIAKVDSSTTSYKDTKVNSGVTYYYSIRCLNSAGKAASSYNKTGKAITYYVTPTLQGAVAVASGIKVSWDAVAGAPNYLVYRLSGSTWKKLGTTTGTSYTDKKVDPNKTYTYTVRVVDAGGTVPLSGIDTTGVSGQFFGKVEVTSLSNTQTGVEIKWSTISGASDYRVYRKFGNGEWELITTESGNSYVDTEVANNITYTYRVRGYNGSDPAGNYDEEGKSITFYAPPKMVEARRQESGILVVWESVEGISNYCIYRKVNGVGDWKKLGFSAGAATSVPGQLSYLDTTLPSGAEAAYTVRCCVGTSGVSSIDTTGVSTTSSTFHEQPLLTGVAPAVGGIKVTWQAVDGVTDYQILRKDSSHTSWDPITIVSGATEYLDPDVDNGGDVKVGERYTYTVACSDGTDMTSEYNETGLSATYYLAPTMISAANRAAGVYVTWNKMSGVNTYRVFRKTGSASWTEVATVTGTSYTDSDVKSAGHYNYAVACVINGAVMSAHEDPGVETTFYEAPIISSLAPTSSGLKVTWNSVDGIDTYRLYYIEDNGTLSIVPGASSVSGTSFIDGNVESGRKYTYTVRCVSGGSLVSSYNPTGKTTTFYAAPVLVSATAAVVNNVSQVTVKWNNVLGAPKYAIYRKKATESWKKVGTSTTITYVDKTVEKGYTYFYTVRVIGTDGTKLSSYDTTGLQVKAK